MASAALAHNNFPSRATYGASNKLPDRSAANNNPPPFGQSSVARRPEQPQQQPQQFLQHPPQQHTNAGQGSRQNVDRDVNALQELSEEQREEVSEAV